MQQDVEGRPAGEYSNMINNARQAHQEDHSGPARCETQIHAMRPAAARPQPQQIAGNETNRRQGDNRARKAYARLHNTMIEAYGIADF